MWHKLLLLASFMSLGVYGAIELWQRIRSCAPHVRLELPSPNGVRSAVLYSMDCEATSGLDTHIALMTPGGDFRPERHPPVFVLDGSHDVRLSWQSDRKLIVELPPGPMRIEQQADSAGPVSIEYRRAAEAN